MTRAPPVVSDAIGCIAAQPCLKVRMSAYKQWKMMNRVKGNAWVAAGIGFAIAAATIVGEWFGDTSTAIGFGIAGGSIMPLLSNRLSKKTMDRKGTSDG